MTRNAKRGLLESSPSSEIDAVVADTMLPQPTDSAHPGDGLFPADPPLPIARPVPVQTSGRLEFAARCVACGDWHRHVGLGEKRGPCGTRYRLEFKTKLQGAA